MPELPEVETIRNNLRRGDPNTPSLLEMKVIGALILWDRTLAVPSKAEFLARLPGQKIKALDRRGKYLIFKLSNDFLLIHLRMSGDLCLSKATEPIDSYCRLALVFEDNWRLSFLDTRKFGRVWLVENPDSILRKLGPEPLDPDFDPKDFFLALQKRKRQIKPLLLDQSFLAGLGNIYTDEALFLAKVHPLTVSNTISEEHSNELFKSIRQVLSDGIKQNGSSIDWVYRGGEHQNYFFVYDRADRPCRNCESMISRIVVGQRGTHYCPVCQPQPA